MLFVMFAIVGGIFIDVIAVNMFGILFFGSIRGRSVIFAVYCCVVLMRWFFVCMFTMRILFVRSTCLICVLSIIIASAAVRYMVFW